MRSFSIEPGHVSQKRNGPMDFWRKRKLLWAFPASR